MRKRYRLERSMKEHPETGELLYPGTVFECEESLIPAGWLPVVGPNRPETICVVPVDKTTPQLRILQS
jgi:hypothetical protein